MNSIADRMSGLAGGGKEKSNISSRMGDQAAPEKADAAGGHFQIHDHGDGTFHSVSKDGEQTEHPHVGHLAAHVAAHHEPSGKHFNVHQSEDGVHISHQAQDGGEVEGPEEHNSAEEAKEAMGRFLDEESQEPAHEQDRYGGGGRGEGLF